MTTNLTLGQAAPLLIALLLMLGGWLAAQSRDESGQPRMGTVRVGTLLTAAGLLLGVLGVPQGLPPLTYAGLLAVVLLVGLLLLRGGARRAIGWTSAAEAFTTAAGMAWGSPRRALVALLSAGAGLSLAVVLAGQGAPLAGLLGAALVLAPARWWMGAAWKRERTRTGVERAMAGLLAGGAEWDGATANLRGAPVKIRFDAEQIPTRVIAPLPPAWAVSKTEDLEAEIAGRLREIAPAWTVVPDPFRRLVKVTRSAVLPTVVPYEAQDGPRRSITVGPARISRAAAVAGLGEFGAEFPLCWDAQRSPHGLIVGLTGAGKSAAAYVVIVTWCRSGNDVWLCDPKRVEFTPLRGRQGVERVAVDLEEITATLEQAVGEMERRYRVMAEHGARNVFKLPEAQRPTPLLVVVDEVFELLAKKGGTDDLTKEINGQKARCATALSSIMALGRAADVHALLLCQRADRAVVEGSLQNNLSFRLLADPAQAGSAERHMIGLQEVEVTTSTPGRAVAKSQGVPEVELQVLWLDDDDLDRWLPVVNEEQAVRPSPKTAAERALALVPPEQAAEPVSLSSSETEAEALLRGREATDRDQAAPDPETSPAPAHSGTSRAPGQQAESAPESCGSDPGNPAGVTPGNPAESGPESGAASGPRSSGRGPRIDWDYMTDFEG